MLLLLLSYSVMPEYFRSHGLQHTRLHCLLDFAQTHFHWIDDAIQPSHLLSPPFPPAFNLFQHPGLFQWVTQLLASDGQNLGSSASASDLHWIFLVDFLSGWLVWPPSSLGDSQEFSPAPQFKSIKSLVLSLLLWSDSHICTWLLEKNIHSFIYHILNISCVLKPLQIWETEEQRNPCLSSTQMWKEIHTYTDTSHNYIIHRLFFNLEA